MADDDDTTTEVKEQDRSRRSTKRAEKGGERRLRNYVHVTDPETQQVKHFGPEDEVPSWAQELITNPKAWDTYDEPGIPVEGVPAPGPNQFAGATELVSLGNQSKSQLYGRDKDELRTFAEDAGIDTSNLSTKQDLVEAITAR